MPAKNTTNRPLEGSFLFDPADPIYAGHFPGAPVVPGSLIIQAFILAARSVLKVESVREVRDFRFRKFVKPGEYAYRIEVKGRDIRCTLFSGDSTAATGVLGL